MNPFVQLYRRLDLLQRTLRFRIAASILVVIACAGLFAPLLVQSHKLGTQRAALHQALAGQSLAAGDEHAVSFVETGTVVVNGRTYGGPQLQRRAAFYVDDYGSLAAAGLVEALLADQRPGWAPRILVEQPGTTWMLAVVTMTGEA